MSVPQNPYRPGSPEWVAYERQQGRNGAYPNLMMGSDNATVPSPSTTPASGYGGPPPTGPGGLGAPNSPQGSANPRDNPMPAGAPQAAQPRPVAPTPMPGQQPAPQPKPAAAGNRTYDAKGHASDGSQSVGLDNPWKIGAFAGGTYDHETLAQLAAIADGKAKGAISPAEAAYVLNTVGFKPDGQPNYEQRWAQGRKLDRYAQTPEAGGTSPWWHDPANAPADQQAGYGGAYGSEATALANYGWWDQPDGKPTQGRQAATPTATPPPATPAPDDGTGDPLGNGQDPNYSADPNNPDHAVPDARTQVKSIIAPQEENLRDWWSHRG